MEKYVPDMYKKSIYEIDYKKIKELGITHLLFDLDNTLVPGHVKSAPASVKELFESLKEMGFHVVIFSNSPSSRLKPFQKYLEVDVNAFSMKPMQRGFRRILKKYRVTKEQVAIIGDQMLTDIVGGNKAGIFTILITPISIKDMVLTKWNRRKEIKIIRKLEEQERFKRNMYYDEKM